MIRSRGNPILATPRKCSPFRFTLSWDLLSSLIGRQGDRTPHRAQNVNTIDEVPDSSWFTNRAGSFSLTDVDVARGPDTTTGPAPGRWTVVSGKSEVRPGFYNRRFPRHPVVREIRRSWISRAGNRGGGRLHEAVLGHRVLTSQKRTWPRFVAMTSCWEMARRSC